MTNSTPLPEAVMQAIKQFGISRHNEAITLAEYGTESYYLPQMTSEAEVARQHLISSIQALLAPRDVEVAPTEKPAVCTMEEAVKKGASAVCSWAFLECQPTGQHFGFIDDNSQALSRTALTAIGYPAIVTAAENVLIAGNHLTSNLLKRGIHPEQYENYDHFLDCHTDDVADIWLAWEAAMELREALKAEGE